MLQEFVGWKALEIKTKDSVGRKYGEKREDKEEKRYYTNYYFNQNHSLETGWLYDQSNWYYLAKTEINGENYIGGERRAVGSTITQLGTISIQQLLQCKRLAISW